MSINKTCHCCGQLGHLAHYCPSSDNHGILESNANREWCLNITDKDDQAILEALQELLTSAGWISRVKVICRLCIKRPKLLELANKWRNDKGHSLLSLALSLNLRNSIQLLWSSGISCGVSRANSDSYFLLMKMADVVHNEQKYSWFTGKSDLVERLEREGATIDAYLRFSLMWDCSDDLDLHVICPSGEEIMYSKKKSTCGGFLDVDMNATSPYSKLPVENIMWATSEPPAGEYIVIVNNFCHRTSRREVPFSVEIVSQGRTPLRLSGSWRSEDGTGNREIVHRFNFDPSEPPDQISDVVPEQKQEQSGVLVHNVNRLAGFSDGDTLAHLVWLILRVRDLSLLDICIALGLHQGTLSHPTIVSPQWCFLQAIWAKNLPGVEQLIAVCGNAINVNHKYRWDAIPWDETVAQMCWRECHGDEKRDKPWMDALRWLASVGADFSQVKLNFHRWRKPHSMQESQVRTFNRLIWHLSDENGWTSQSSTAASYLARSTRELAFLGAHIPEDLDPSYVGPIEWGVNGKRPAEATSYCYGNLDVELVREAIHAGRLSPREKLISALCALKKACPMLHGSTKCYITSFLFPGLGHGPLSYAALQKSEGGRVKGGGEQQAGCSERSEPPRGYVCGRCRRAGHWRKFCPRAQPGS